VKVQNKISKMIAKGAIFKKCCSVKNEKTLHGAGF
jgi:hypothetical protein